MNAGLDGYAVSERLRQRGVTDQVKKPFAPREPLERIVAALERR